MGGDQFTCRSFSVRELLLWTLAVCDRFFLCRCTKQYFILMDSFLYKNLFLFTLVLFLNSLSHFERSWQLQKELEVNYLLLHSLSWLRLLYFLHISLVVLSVTFFFKSSPRLGTWCFIYVFIFIFRLTLICRLTCPVRCDADLVTIKVIKDYWLLCVFKQLKLFFNLLKPIQDWHVFKYILEKLE